MKRTWVPKNLPPQTRYGMYQNIIPNLRPVWEIRQNENVYNIFKESYNTIRKYREDGSKTASEAASADITEFVTSMDGLNIQPNTIPSQQTKDQDWAHLDQKHDDDVFKCIQGQAILTNTSACFRATPKSHHYFKDFAKYHTGFRFSDAQVNEIKNILKKDNIPYQIPIRAPKGSFIIWLSSVIHSAISVNEVMTPTPDDPFR
eukprot:Pgem_evm1s12107